MHTKLSRYADGIMEAAWLAAIIVVPVFFNVYSSRIFEPDKITTLRTLALVILAAWGLKLLEQGGPRWERIAVTGRWKTLLRIPLVAPVLALAVVYIISTIFSVSPYTSFWGSYQRLQGAYTTLSYLVLFAALVGNLRRRAQLERLVTTAILSSLPVSLYGVLQRYGADPIPWGGDVTARIASNMGNSIFVAAYLIMVFPLTLMRLIEAFEALLSENRGRPVANFVRATIYVFIIALQVIALYFSGSRGPWLGWAASMVLVWLGLSLVWRKRWMVVTGVGVAILAGAFLVTLNIPNGPLESLRDRPEFGRLGQLLDSESRTGRVRVLIWQGAAELVLPHAPLEYPDGRSDKFNFLRPIIGYGPESMYVAYNPFYQPELTLVEKRNASPDRSHNETWDSLVITGGLGLLLYLAIYGSVIYFSLKWLGLVPNPRRRNLFLGLYILGGVISTAVFVALRGIAYLGVALPFGMILGTIIYLIVASLGRRLEGHTGSDEKMRAYVLVGLSAAVVAHFVEINFGIAIAATNTYFWVYAGLILLAGFILPRHGEYAVEDLGDGSASETAPEMVENETSAAPALAEGGRRSKANRSEAASRKKRVVARSERPLIDTPWLREALIAAGVTALLLGCLGYNFISNSSRSTFGFDLIWSSLTTLSNKGGGVSYGLLAMVLTTWLAGGLLLVSESGPRSDSQPNSADLAPAWGRMAAVALGGGFFVAFIFWLWHASGMAALNAVNATTIEMVMKQVGASESILTRFYVFLFVMLFGMGGLLPWLWPAQGGRFGVGSPAIGAGAAILVFVLASYTNLRVIQADIAFKTAELFARPGTWPAGIQIYDEARNLAPNEDYYYLFLGRAYLEYAKTLNDPGEREALIQQAATDLKDAQRINPLNTDHTANLARLHSLWSSYTTDPALKQTRAALADDYFKWAVRLSPQSARLWDEWAVHAMNVMNQPEQARQRLEQALKIDPFYDWTYGLMGDYYLRFVADVVTATLPAHTEALINAGEYYTQAVGRSDSSTTDMRYGYLVAFGGVQAQLNQPVKALQAYVRALEVWPDNPDRWRVEAALAQLYAQVGDMSMALQYAQEALAHAPDEQKPAVQNLIAQLGGTP